MRRPSSGEVDSKALAKWGLVLFGIFVLLTLILIAVEDKLGIPVGGASRSSWEAWLILTISAYLTWLIWNKARKGKFLPLQPLQSLRDFLAEFGDEGLGAASTNGTGKNFLRGLLGVLLMAIFPLGVLLVLFVLTLPFIAGELILTKVLGFVPHSSTAEVGLFVGSMVLAGLMSWGLVSSWLWFKSWRSRKGHP